LFTPWLWGERCPVADAGARASFFGQSLRTGRAHLVRAVLEGVAFNTRWLLQSAEKFCGRRLDPIRIIGGGARSELWCRIFADVLDRRIDRVDDPVQCNTRGAGLVAALGLGLTSVDRIAEDVKVASQHEPNREHRARYDEMFGAYVDLYRRGKPILARLARTRDESSGVPS
jgi:xylulokinase